MSLSIMIANVLDNRVGNSESSVFTDKINTYRTRNNGVFIFNYSNTGKLFRIFTPFNDHWAQFWTVEKEISSSSDYYQFSGPQGVCEYFQILSPTSRTGTWTNFGTSSSSYTTNIGATLSFSFTGVGFDIRHITDNRGGVYRFAITNGVITEQVDVSTWSDSASTPKINTPVIDNLPYDTYSVVATFIGSDPLHAPTGGTARGWLCTDYVSTNVGLYDRPIWVIGSPTPNFAHPPIALGNTPIGNYIYSPSSHREYAWQGRKVGSATSLSDGWVPLHGNSGNATTFANLTTDRFLQFDNSGTNLISSIGNVYTLGIGGTELTLYQKFKGYNPNGSSADELFDITQTWTWTNRGLKINTRIEVITDLDDDNTCYGSMFDAPIKAANQGFEFIIMDNGDELVTTGSGPTEELYTKLQLQSGIWEGGQISVNKTGTDFEKSVVQAIKINNVSTIMKFEKNLNQSIQTWLDGTRRKNYMTYANNGAGVTTGEVWEWEAEWIMGVVPDAYNVLKP